MTWLILWVSIGCIASIIAAIIDYKSGRDITVGYIWTVLFWSLLGPIWAFALIQIAVDDCKHKIVIKAKK